MGYTANRKLVQRHSNIGEIPWLEVKATNAAHSLKNDDRKMVKQTRQRQRQRQVCTDKSTLTGTVTYTGAGTGTGTGTATTSTTAGAIILVSSLALYSSSYVQKNIYYINI